MTSRTARGKTNVRRTHVEGGVGVPLVVGVRCRVGGHLYACMHACMHANETWARHRYVDEDDDLLRRFRKLSKDRSSFFFSLSLKRVSSAL